MRIKEYTIFSNQKRGKLCFLRCILFVVVMLVATTNTFAQAHFEIIDGLRYLIDENVQTATLVANPDRIYSGDIVVPEKVQTKYEMEYPVVALGESCFSDCSDLISVIIPSSVTSLGASCFSGCSGLTGITIPSSVTSLGEFCFGGCSGLTNITIPSSVTSLGQYCFSSCFGLTSITIPSSVTSLGEFCFGGCSGLTNITIPSSVTSLGQYCFWFCSGLTSITIPSSVTSLGASCFSGCSGLTSITIPSSVTSLGESCFSDCSGLTSIIIPSSVTSLGESCFSGCSGLTSIIIPSSVTSLGESCFRGCLGLTSITIPPSVTSLGESCFSDCSGLTSIIIPSSVILLGRYCLSCCNLESIYFDGKLPNNTIESSIPTYCIFYVPKNYLQDYKDALGSKYQYIYARTDEGGDDKPTTQCDAPSITYNDGKLHFFSSTPGAEYHYTITDSDMANDVYSQDGIVQLSAVYQISAYATADGYQASDKSTATLYWINANFENNPSSNINQVNTRGIVVTSQSGNVTLSGLSDGEVIRFFAPDGKQLGSTKAVNGIASCAVVGSMVIAKVGDRSLKLVVEQ